MPRTWLTLAILILLLTACALPETPAPTISAPIPATLTPTFTQTLESSATLTPNPTENAQATLSANATNNAVHYATSAVAMTATALVRPTLTPTPTPISSLTNREPSFEELENFLDTDLKDFWLADKWAVETFYEDVNGDGVTELIVLHPPEIFVLLWTGKVYNKIYYLNGYCGSRCFPSSFVKFEDWTKDGISEIVFDNTHVGGGSGYWTYDLTREVIQCFEYECKTVWKSIIQSDSDDYNESMISRYKVQISLIVQDGTPAIRTITQSFNIFTNYSWSTSESEMAFYDFTFLDVGQTTVSIYLWNGENFLPSEEEVFALPYSTESRAIFFAENKLGIGAGIRLLDQEPDLFTGMNNLCQVFVSHVSAEETFPCKNDFTMVSWQDITGDGQDEVIVQALFGSDPGETFDCAVQQRLLAYTWDGHTATLIADASGCVTRPDDLYGVRLDDYDGDSLPEIIAAQLDADNPERIYKFNGMEFVFWSVMPQK